MRMCDGQRNWKQRPRGIRSRYDLFTTSNERFCAANSLIISLCWWWEYLGYSFPSTWASACILSLDCVCVCLTPPPPISVEAALADKRSGGGGGFIHPSVHPSSPPGLGPSARARLSIACPVGSGRRRSLEINQGWMGVT